MNIYVVVGWLFGLCNQTWTVQIAYYKQAYNPEWEQCRSKFGGTSQTQMHLDMKIQLSVWGPCRSLAQSENWGSKTIKHMCILVIALLDRSFCSASDGSRLFCPGWSSPGFTDAEVFWLSDIMLLLLISCQQKHTHTHTQTLSSLVLHMTVNWHDLKTWYVKLQQTLVISVICSCNEIYYIRSSQHQQPNLTCFGRDLGWHLDTTSFWTWQCGGVKAEKRGQCTLVGQGDSPWNSLAHDMQTEVDELAVNLQLVRG